jgi:hypothetical protein
MSDYELDDRAIQFRSSAEAKDLSSNLWVQNGSGAHPASCPVGTGDPFPGGKTRPGRDADPIYFRGCEWVGSIPPLPQAPSLVCCGDCFTFNILVVSGRGAGLVQSV